MRHHLDITADDFIGGDTNLSLGSTYNKVTVTADLYGMDTIIHDQDDIDNFKYSERLDEAGKSYGRNQILESTAKGTVILTGWQDTEKKNHLQKTIYRFKDLVNDKASQGNFLNYFQTRWYNLDTSYPHDGTLIGIWGTTMNPSHNTNYDDLYTKVGASYVEYLSEEIEVDSGIDPKDLKITGDKTTAIVMSLHNSKLYDSSRMDFDRQQSGYNSGYWYIDEKGDGKDIVWEDFMKNQILFSVITKRIIIGEGDYIFIKGKWKFYANNESFCPINYWEKEEKPHSINSFVWCQLSDGNGLYWDGEIWKPASEFKGPTGVTLNPKFPMPYNVSGKTSRYDEEFPITSYADFDLNLEEEGYIIPAPPCKPGMSRPVTLNFHIYKPWGPTWTSDNIADLAILEDFDMTVTGKKEETIDSEDNSNTSYTNILLENAIEEYPDLELKITSWDNKQINRSSTYWFELSPKSMTGSRDPVTYVASNFTRTQEIANKSTGQLGRPEELLVGNITKQYSTPTASLGVTLFNSLGITPYSTLSYHFMGPRTFVVDGMTIDYSYDTVNLKLIERK
jgi:hypothetical protein